MSMKLDRATVAALKDDGGRGKIVFDTDLIGFGVRVRTDSKGKLRKNFLVQYRIDGRQRRQKIKANDVESARKKAISWLGKVHEGIDPAAAKELDRAASALTFQKAVDQYLKLKALEVRPSSLRHTSLYLTHKRYFGQMHPMALTKITRSDVSTCVNKITVDSGAVAAGRARAHLSAFFTWAMKNGHTDANPVINSVNPKGSSRDRVLKDVELVKVWNACGDDDYGKIIRLLMLTGCRRVEIGGLKWSEIDLDNGLMRLPALRTKNGHAHELPLTPMALDIINSVPRRVDRDYLFGDRSPFGFTEWGRGKAALHDGITEPWTPHDLRRSLATGMCELGIQPHVVEQVLNHQGGHKSGVAGIYNKATYQKEVKIALARWADHVASIVRGNKSNVVNVDFAQQQPA